MRSYFFIFVFSVSFFLNAQTKTFVGVKMGGGGSTVFMRHSVFPVIADIKWRPGVHGGILVTHFSQKLKSKINSGIQIGVNYVQKGWVQSFDDITETNHKTRIDYLEFPLEAIGYLGDKNKYYMSVGFFLEYAIRAKVDPTPATAKENANPDIGTKTVGQSTFYRYDLKKDNRINYGPRGAIGVFRETEIGVFRLEGFFSFSIRSVFDFEPIKSQIPNLSFNYGAGVSVSYMFSFGKLNI